MESPNLEKLLDAINDRGVVAGYTHNFYRYPARFSPLFARAAIQAFTNSGDTILDPFMGSSTTLVEALALGRHAVGADISALAVFLAGAKTSLLTDRELGTLAGWAIETIPDLSPSKPVFRHAWWSEAGYQDNLPWRFRKIAEQALNTAGQLPGRVQAAARCIVLKTVQWAVDCKKRLPTAGRFRDQMLVYTTVVTDGLLALRQQVKSLQADPTIIEAHQCAAAEILGVKSDLLNKRPPRLIVTSPPYPGVHVLYHRWQVLGRRETAAPFWIADCQDGQGGAYYTFGDRRRQDYDEQYFNRLGLVFTALRNIVRDDCVVAQLVGFARPEEHLPPYVDMMRKTGFQEYGFRGRRRQSTQNEFWRAVPNRKWYTCLRPDATQASEVLLVHRAR